MSTQQNADRRGNNYYCRSPLAALYRVIRMIHYRLEFIYKFLIWVRV